jgi:hypothetical protein
MGQIYDKTVNEIMVDFFNKLNQGDVFTTREMIDFFRNNFPKIKQGTITAHLLKFSTNSKTRVYYNARRNGKCDLLFKIDENKYRLYDKARDPSPFYKDNIEEENPKDNISDDNVNESDQEFAYEKDLQNYLAKNLQIIEQGLKLFEEDDITGIEYPVGGRFIDILAVDKNNDFVIFELKVSKGYDRVIGQLLRYIGWVEKNMATDGQKVRGIIVCKEITDDLLLACSKINDINLFEYELSFKINKIK